VPVANAANQTVELSRRLVLLVGPKPKTPITVPSRLVWRRIARSHIDLVEVKIEHFEKCLAVALFIQRPHVIGVVVIGDIDALRLGCTDGPYSPEREQPCQEVALHGLRLIELRARTSRFATPPPQFKSLSGVLNTLPPTGLQISIETASYTCGNRFARSPTRSSRSGCIRAPAWARSLGRCSGSSSPALTGALSGAIFSPCFCVFGTVKHPQDRSRWL